MQILNGLDTVQMNQATTVTVGTFDGIHRGHRKIIEEVIQLARSENLVSTILTFEPPPRMVLQQNSKKKVMLLTTFEEKINILQNFGLDRVIVVPFTRELAEMSYKSFVEDILIEKVRAAWIVVGHDHTFGKNRQGNFESLQRLSRQHGFRLKEVGALQYAGQTISSSQIRDLLLAGDVVTSSSMLGYPYTLQGKVVPGAGRGRKLNFVTANIDLADPHKLVPANGVYVVDCFIREKNYRGMANIGIRPTFGETTLTLEVHVFNFSEMIYGEWIRISFLQRLRGEIKFKNESELIRQLQKDKIKSNQY
jgi:riboflavin kinase/FMN adenylyltransferase